MIEEFYDAFPFLDFRVEGMGFLGSALFLSALAFAFGRDAIWAAMMERFHRD